jgi:TPR repeat protein
MKALLVFGRRLPTVLIMHQPWYQKLFSPALTPAPDNTQAEADQGDAEAQFSLGLKYANSEGAGQDYAQAAQWYLKAAEQSHTLAQFNLGMIYAKGQGVPRDDARAALWFRKAAERGDAGAQFNLGRSRHRASLKGLPAEALESRIEAYKWLRLAAEQGYQGSDSARSSVILSMTREEVTEGNNRANAFVVART